MAEREKQIAMVLATAVLALIVVAFFLLVVDTERAPEPSPEPELVKVETHTAVRVEEASTPPPNTPETPANDTSVFALLEAEDCQEPQPYQSAWLTEQPYWDTVTGIQDYMEKYWPAGFEPEIEIYLGWRERYPEGWANLVRWGRGEQPPRQLPPPMEEACKLAACAQTIDDYLATRRDSPLQGYGREFARAGYDWGVNPYLLVGLAGKESTFATNGSLSRTNHNAWGMLGTCPGVERLNGACWWPDWPSAISGAAYFVSVYWPGAQNAYDLRGYCEGNPPEWIRCVEHFRAVLTYLGGEL